MVRGLTLSLTAFLLVPTTSEMACEQVGKLLRRLVCMLTEGTSLAPAFAPQSRKMAKFPFPNDLDPDLFGVDICDPSARDYWLFVSSPAFLALVATPD